MYLKPSPSNIFPEASAISTNLALQFKKNLSQKIVNFKTWKLYHSSASIINGKKEKTNM